MENKIDFIGQGSYSCVFRPSIKCNNTIDTNNANDIFFVSKISKKDKYIENEFYISSIIQQIPRYYNNFSPILDKCDANLYKLASNIGSSTEFQKCNLFNKNNNIFDSDSDSDSDYENNSDSGSSSDTNSDSENKISGNNEKEERTSYTEQQISYIYNKIRYVGHNDLYSFLTNTNWEDTFLYLAYSISLLYGKGIVHYDLKGNNVMIHDKHYTPIIIDFGLSIDTNTIIQNTNETILKRIFYVYNSSYNVWCPEIIFICYLTQNRQKSLSEIITTEDINFVCDDFFKNTKIFKEDQLQEKQNYIEEIRTFFTEFRDKTAINTIIELTQEYYKTWDMYSLTICFKNIVSLPINYMKYISANPKKRRV